MHTPTLYRQWAEHDAQAIHSGALPPGERMPSLRDWMARHAVSLSTAVQVCRTLAQPGEGIGLESPPLTEKPVAPSPV